MSEERLEQLETITDRGCWPSKRHWEELVEEVRRLRGLAPRWTADPPTEDGLYWVKGVAGAPTIPTQAVFVAVLGPNDLRWGRTADQRRTPFFRTDDKEWAGPIPEPVEG